ncbi:MAG: DUF1080 domain-containing protein [Tannerella sp.]|jgi:hypothetical protein|nr:DUF1080 domain-containing protein [Tannerella sp.]
MKLKALLFTLICCILFAACSEKGAKTLFNGKDLKGWTTEGQTAVKDGVMTLSGKDAKAVLTKGDLKNFVVELDIRTTPGGKGALWFHTDGTLSKGYKVAINNDITDEVWWRMTGSLVSVRNLTKSIAKEGEWFKLRISVDYNSILVSVNGIDVVEYNQPDEPYRIGENTNTLISSGTLALESQGNGEIQLRSIVLETLPDEHERQLVVAIDENDDEIIRLHQADFPVLEYHAHLKGGLTVGDICNHALKSGINYAIAPNCGIGFPITDDAGVIAFLDSFRHEPVTLAMQAEGREWVTTFSQSVRDEFDYVFTDAMTFIDAKGRRTRLWISDETWIENEQQYMDLIVDKICGVLTEPMDIYVNPCFLPEKMADRYDEFWTEARMDKFVAALAKSGKALEINNRYRIPNLAIIKKAKDAGVKFTCGTNNAGNSDLGRLEYFIETKKALGIKASEMYKPKIKL